MGATTRLLTQGIEGTESLQQEPQPGYLHKVLRKQSQSNRNHDQVSYTRYRGNRVTPTGTKTRLVTQVIEGTESLQQEPRLS